MDKDTSRIVSRASLINRVHRDYDSFWDCTMTNPVSDPDFFKVICRFEQDIVRLRRTIYEDILDYSEKDS